jgi:hypothetical protein
MKIVALLDTYWGGEEHAGKIAPRYFRINRNNHSGRNLYRLLGSHSLLVSDCCRLIALSAKHHGAPEADWVSENLGILAQSGRMDLLLVCGKVAQKTFREIASIPSGSTDGQSYISGIGILRFYMIDHPAARNWSIEKFERTKTHIERLLNA